VHFGLFWASKKAFHTPKRHQKALRTAQNAPLSVVPLFRMLLTGYCYGIRSERRLCEEVHLNPAYRWFCRLSLDTDVPDHSTFSKNRHGRASRPKAAILCLSRDVAEVPMLSVVSH
jgi:transposase